MKLCHILICGLCAAFCHSTNAEWQIEKHTDEMTDEVSFALVCPGEPVNQGTIHAYIPKLIIEITPKEYNTRTKDVLSTISARFSVSNDRINGRYVATVRFDKNPAEDWDFSESSTSRSGFLDRPHEFNNRLKKSNRVLLRFRSWSGEYTTLSFDVAGYQKAVADMYSAMSKDRIGSVKYSNKPKCAKCGGTREIVTGNNAAGAMDPEPPAARHAQNAAPLAVKAIPGTRPPARNAMTSNETSAKTMTSF